MPKVTETGIAELALKCTSVRLHRFSLWMTVSLWAAGLSASASDVCTHSVLSWGGVKEGLLMVLSSLFSGGGGQNTRKPLPCPLRPILHSWTYINHFLFLMPQIKPAPPSYPYLLPSYINIYIIFLTCIYPSLTLFASLCCVSLIAFTLSLFLQLTTPPPTLL